MNTILDVTTTGDKPDEAAQRRAFYADVVGTDGQGYCLAELKPGGGMVHTWADTFEGFIQQAEKRVGRVARYYALAAYGNETNDKGKRARTQANAISLKVFPLDIDCGAEKHAKNPAGTYATLQEGIAALKAFIKATGLRPTYVVESGAGLHVYFVMDKPVPVAEWEPVARALGDLAKVHGLRVDTSVTTNAAGVLRLIGSEHQNGRRVKVGHVSGKVYGQAEFAAKVGAGSGIAQKAVGRVKLIAANDQLGMAEPPPFSARKAAEKCMTLKDIADKAGAVPEPVWRGMIGVVKFSTEGADLAHEWSTGDARYDHAQTQEKFDRYGAAPITCEYFRKHCATCAGCKHEVTSPAQLGRLDRAEAAELPEEVKPEVPAHIAELNRRYALVTMGSDTKVVDFETSVHTVAGFKYVAGFTSIASLQHRYAEWTVRNGDRDIRAVDDWRRSPHRRQFDGTVMAPPPCEAPPPSLLNLYQGWGCEPTAGDVAPWLELLEALVPDVRVRRYALNLFAWKVQNPGSVPGAILIFTGGKGTGKNSLMEALVRMFGVHGQVFDDPEQVAGRFTLHLRTLLFIVLDEALFAGDPRQADRIKARTTATSMTYEGKGLDPVNGVNMGMYVLLTNHLHVWQATIDERRAVVVETGNDLQGRHDFWARYYKWLDAGGAGALLGYLQRVNLGDFNPRIIPKSAALTRQIALTSLRSPAAAWWFSCLSEGAVSGHGSQRVVLNTDEVTLIDKSELRMSFTASRSGRGADAEWPAAMRMLKGWTNGLHETRARSGDKRVQMVELPALTELRATFTTATGVHDFGGA